jgi:integrase
VLRRVLRLSVEWGALESAPKVELLTGERRCERVVTSEEESRYLTAASPLLASVATVLTDTGLRPDECHGLRWEETTWVNGCNGTLLVTHGNTKTARRVLLTPRVRGVLEHRWMAAGKPLEGWVWPAPTKTGHVDHSSLKKEHGKALKLSGVRCFVLYSLRHTLLARLGESGCDAWTLARVAGHSSVAVGTILGTISFG